MDDRDIAELIRQSVGYKTTTGVTDKGKVDAYPNAAAEPVCELPNCDPDETPEEDKPDFRGELELTRICHPEIVAG